MQNEGSSHSRINIMKQESQVTKVKPFCNNGVIIYRGVHTPDKSSNAVNTVYIAQ